MSISISPDGRRFQLDTADTSYHFNADRYGALIHNYYGRRIPFEDLSDGLFFADVGFSGNPWDAGEERTYSLDTLPQEYSGYGNGDTRESSIVLTFPDGSRAADFRYESHEALNRAWQIPGLPALWDTAEEPAQTLVVTLKERASEVRLQLVYTVFELENVIARSARIINDGAETVNVGRCFSCCVDFGFGDYELMTFPGRHCMERVPQRQAVRHAKQEIYSLRGTSSHQMNPTMILCRPDTTETQGECWGVCLAYSGSFVGSAQKDQRGQTRAVMGIHPEQFSWELVPGERFDAPQAILSYSNRGFERLSHQYHDILRDHMCRGKWVHCPRPVVVNTWEAAYFNFDREVVLRLAKDAAAIGVDMLVLDDGWFGHRDSDTSSLGDWYENTGKLGGTLASLSDAIHAEGLMLGLWVEPEMISEDSDLYRAHPDWALAIEGRKPVRSRCQLVLDMSRKDVRDYLFERLYTILSGARIEYVKWDFNRSLCELWSHAPGARQGETAHRWMLGVYELFERIITAFPGLLIENCSGGGGRFDAGMLYYSPQIWCSDNTDAVNRLDIQYGTSFFYPMSAVAAHVSVCPNHQTGRSVPMATRAAVALTGAFGYEMDLCKLSDVERAQVTDDIRTYKAREELFREGRYHRLTGPEDACAAWMYVSRDGKKALLGAVMRRAEGNALPANVPVRGLNPDVNYRCSLTNAVHSGAVWMACGLTLPVIYRQYESSVAEFEGIDG